MVGTKVRLIRKTVQETLRVSHRNYCHHVPPISGVVDWDNAAFDLKTRQNIERHWRKEVTKYRFNENDRKSKMYVLAMIPYPSGSLHMGHVRVYTISDTFARYQRLKGKNVLHPMGWDSFGLPAENAARERGVDPDKWTKENIAQMRQQLDELGLNFDWDREVSTCSPEFYRWTQWLFLKLYHAGLVYKKESLVNWDPVDKTVLADEQVDANNCSWRSGAKIERKLLKQWFIQTSRFTESLQEGLEDLRQEDWRDIIKVQRGWIGKVGGTTVNCKILSSSTKQLSLTVWLPKPEEFLSASFLAVSKGSILDAMEPEPTEEVSSYTSDDGSHLKCTFRRLSAKLVHPLTGDELPIFVVDGFLRFQHGAETYIGNPESSEKDKKFLELASAEGAKITSGDSSKFGADVREGVCAELQKRGIGGWPTSSSHRDWLISRQRYWGTPIPMINCDNCQDTIPVPFEDLPVTLPPSNPGDVCDSKGLSLSPLHNAKEWLHTSCPKCGGKATRETDTMDTFVDSSWYYLRFLDAHNSKTAFNKELSKELMPVDLYVGGKEHANLHLYYARFIGHFLHSQGYMPEKEPFQRLLPQGMVMGRCFTHPETGRFLKHDEIDFSGPKPVDRESGKIANVTWEKMSKSKHNGVSPASVIQDYGADTTRIIMLADATPQSQKNWNPETSGGAYRWQNRVFNLVSKLRQLRREKGWDESASMSKTFSQDEQAVWNSRNRTVSVVSFNFDDTLQLSVAITSMMHCAKFLQTVSPEIMAQSAEYERALASLLIMIGPMAPHFASELWQAIASAPFLLTKNRDEFDWNLPVLEQRWPIVDEEYGLNLIIKVNGSEICSVKVPRKRLDVLRDVEAGEIALQSTEIQEIIGDNAIRNISLRVVPAYRGHVNLIVPNVQVSMDKLNPVTRAAKKVMYKAKKLQQKS